jgi:hypothetical protein
MIIAKRRELVDVKFPSKTAMVVFPLLGHEHLVEKPRLN